MAREIIMNIRAIVTTDEETWEKIARDCVNSESKEIWLSDDDLPQLNVDEITAAWLDGDDVEEISDIYKSEEM